MPPLNWDRLQSLDFERGLDDSEADDWLDQLQTVNDHFWHQSKFFENFIRYLK